MGFDPHFTDYAIQQADRERQRRREQDDKAKHAEQRSVEREEAMESKFAHLAVTVDEEGSRIVTESVNGFKTGQRIRVLEDADENGPFAGTYADDEGELRIEVVGAPEYYNEHLSYGIKTEHHDEFTDVDPDNIEAAD